MNLKEIYSDLLSNVGFSANEIQQNWLDLEKAYSKKSRHYHNLTHLKEMISSFETYRDKLQNPNEILFSIFYHDFVYSASKKDNELKSSEYALAILPENVSLNKELVFDAICATQQHQQNAIEDINWLIDFDLKILAKDWDDYKIYFEQIRKEYRIYPDFLYKPGRAKALKHFLENEFIFQTEEFRNLYEGKARANIEKEIKLLS
ncbi:HD domain-containing protein [Flavobacterium sp. MMS24-S5]|uniref:HD domain-containing protein n=1 Tax=Flavobacterium sp. MMS24-S5 TaxID=3416605 RepID=UPI003D010021